MALEDLLSGYAAAAALPEGQDEALTSTAAGLAAGLENKEWALLEVVKGLGGSLTSEDDAARIAGVELLSRTVRLVSSASLDRKATTTLVAFFSSKLADSSVRVIMAAVEALTALTAVERGFGVGECTKVADEMFEHLTPLTKFTQPLRYAAFTLLDSLLSPSLRPGLKRMNKELVAKGSVKREFVKGYCEMVEGEKDPRCLVLGFGVTRVVCVEFDITGYVEQLFDITFCYFPITFTPPPGSNYGITSESLITSLRICLASTPRFGPLALPLFMDKLQASSTKAKEQTMQALEECFPVYGRATVLSGGWAGKFAEAMEIEFFSSSEEGTVLLALKAVKSLFGVLYPDGGDEGEEEEEKRVKEVKMGLHEDSEGMDVESENEEMDHHGHGHHGHDHDGHDHHGHDHGHPHPPVQASKPAPPPEKDAPDDEGPRVKGLAVKFVASVLEALSDIGKVDAKKAARLLCALIECSNRLAAYVYAQAIPLLLELWKEAEESDLSSRPPILEALGTLLTPLSSSSTSTVAHDNISIDPQAISKWGDDFLFIAAAAKDPATCAPAIKAMVQLCRIPGYLSTGDARFYISAIAEVFLSPSSSDEASDAALEALVVLAPLHPGPVEDLVLKRLTSPTILPTSPPITDEEKEEYKRALEGLVLLCTHPSLFEFLFVRVLARLEELAAAGQRQEGEQKGARELYAHHLLLTIQTVLGKKAKEGHTDIGKYANKFVPQLMGIFLQPSPSASEEEGGLAADERLLIDAGRIVAAVMRALDAPGQAALLAKLNGAFHGGDLKTLLGDYYRPPSSIATFSPFDQASSKAQQAAVAFFASAIVSVRQDVQVEGDVGTFSAVLLSRALEGQGTLVGRLVKNQLLAVTVNKRGDKLGAFLGEGMERLWSEVVDESKPKAQRERALQSWVWITKGLLVRSDAQGYTQLTSLLSLFPSPVLGATAASSLGVLADDTDGLLSKSNNCVVRLLHRQKFFAFLLPRLTAGHKAAAAPEQEPERATYLLALSALLRHIPRKLAATELPALLPLLATALDLPSPQARISVLRTLALVVEDTPAELAASAAALTGRVIKLVVAPDGEKDTVPADVKVAALDFLSKLPAKVEYQHLHATKPAVLKVLGKVVDDKRKEVRRKAVDARAEWWGYKG